MINYDFLVVGGGVLGLMTARRLVQREPRAKIAVFDGGIPSSASAAAGAMIAPYSEVTEALRRRKYHDQRLTLLLEAAAMWRDALEEVAGPVPPKDVITGRGTVLLRNTVSGPLEDRNFQSIMNCVNERGARFQRLLASDVQGLDPAPHERPVECVLIEDEFSVDSQRLLAWLNGSLQWQNVELYATRIVRVLHDAGHACGVEDENGVAYGAGTVLLAGGVRARSLVPEEAGRRRIPPLFAGTGAAILAGQPPARIDQVVRTPNRSFSCGLHLLPRNGNAVYIGATNNPSSQLLMLPSLSDVEFLINCATRQVNRGLARVPVLGLRAGNRPITLDLYPVVGRTEMAGLWIATGTYREGLTMAPVLADRLVADILDGQNSLPPTFQPMRLALKEYCRENAIKEATDNYLAVAAEHETRLTASGWTDFARDLITSHLNALYDRLPAEFVLPPDLAGLAQEETGEIDTAIRQHLRAWF